MTSSFSAVLILCAYQVIPALSLTCDAENICQSGNYSDDAITCNGAQSCQYSNLISTSKDINCRAHQSCQGTKDTQTFLISKDDIICDGAQSCRYTIVTTHKNANFSLSDKLRAHCRGYQSCEESNIYTWEDLYCHSHQTCHNSSITNIMDRTFCYGLQSCRYAFFQNIYQVFCESNTACRDAIFNNIYEIRCDATQACREVTINNVTTLRAYGTLALYLAQIQNVQIINAYGYRALRFAAIRVDANQTLTLNMYGYQAGRDTTVVCDELATSCDIKCLSSDACWGMIFNCSASECNVVCDESEGIACPEGWQGPSSSPTQIPSFTPSNLPSLRPSVLPSFEPSDAPVHVSDPSLAVPTAAPSQLTTLNLQTAGQGAREDSITKGGDSNEDASVSTCLNNNAGLVVFIVLLVFFLFVSIVLNVALWTRRKATHGLGETFVEGVGASSASSVTGARGAKNGLGLGLERKGSVSEVVMAAIATGATPAGIETMHTGGTGMNSIDAMETIALHNNINAVPGASGMDASGGDDVDMALAMAIARKLRVESKKQSNGEHNVVGANVGHEVVAEAAAAAIGAAMSALAQPQPGVQKVEELMMSPGGPEAEPEVRYKNSEEAEGGRVTGL